MAGAIAPPKVRPPSLPDAPAKQPCLTSFQMRVIDFTDGHAAYFKYFYVVSDGTATRRDGTLAPAGRDPDRPDISWAVEGGYIPE